MTSCFVPPPELVESISQPVQVLSVFYEALPFLIFAGLFVFLAVAFVRLPKSRVSVVTFAVFFFVIALFLVLGPTCPSTSEKITPTMLLDACADQQRYYHPVRVETRINVDCLNCNGSVEPGSYYLVCCGDGFELHTGRDPRATCLYQ